MLRSFGMVTGHTYYLARWDRCYGEHAGDRELCELLKHEWLRRSSEPEPTIVDGVSAWIDEDGRVQICLVRTAVPEMVRDAALSSALGPHLAA